MLADCFSSAGEEGITATFYFGHLLEILFGVHCSMVQAGLGYSCKEISREEWESKRERGGQNHGTIWYTGQVF